MKEIANTKINNSLPLEALIHPTAVVHATAIVEPGARLEAGVTIGPFCHVGRNVHLKESVQLKSHVVVGGHTTIGERTVVYPFAAIGLEPQDKKYANEPSRLEIGSGNVIREYVTMHPGTAQGHMVTKIGNDGLFMIGVHIAHDCVIGNQVIFSNNATLAGHVVVGDAVILGGLCAVHQFVRIGDYAMIGGMAGIAQDIIPYGIVSAEQDHLNGLNFIGLKRRGFSSSDISHLRSVYKLLFSGEGMPENSTFQERLAEAEKSYKDVEAVQFLISFIRQESHRNINMPKDGRIG